MSDITSREAPGLTQADYEALASFRHALRRFLVFSAAAAEGAGLTPQQHQALLAIKGNGSNPPMTVGALADQLIIAPHTAAELVSRMIRADLVLKTGDLQDRRRAALALTHKAETVLRALGLAHLQELRGAAPALMAALTDFNERVRGGEGC